MNRISRLVAGLALAICLQVAHAQELTTAQVVTLKTTCLANQTCAALAATADDFGLAAWFNGDTSTYIVWRTSVSQESVMQDAAFDWTRVDNLSVGKARIWDMMFRFGTVDPSKANVRAGIDAVWVGAAADLAVRASVYVQCKRSATRAEQALATGLGTTASPSVMGWSGSITYQVASQIRS